MSKFISKVILLFASIFSFFNLSLISRADDIPPEIRKALKAADDLPEGTKAYRVMYDDRQCYITGRGKFLCWNKSRKECDWTRFRTLRRTDHLSDYLWDTEYFKEIELLPSSEMNSLFASFPDSRYYFIYLHNYHYWQLNENQSGNL